MEQSLEDWLARERSENWHDEGEFTLDPELAFRKLTQQCLFHPHNWAILAVQALLRLGCFSVCFSQQSKCLWVLGQNPTVEFCPQRLTFHDALTNLQSPTSMLYRALAGAKSGDTVRSDYCWRRFDEGPWEFFEFRPEGAPVSRPEAPQTQPLMAERWAAVGLYLEYSKSPPNLLEHLAYALQYCPIPVTYSKKNWFRQDDRDLRAAHWLHSGPSVASHPSGAVLNLNPPVLLDYFLSSSSAQIKGEGILLKPIGGNQGGCGTSWCECSDKSGALYPWLKIPGAMDSLASFARYFRGSLTQTQSLFWRATRKFGNSAFGERGERTFQLSTRTGDLIAMLRMDEGPDFVLPIQFGATLAPLEGKIGIPGLVVIAPADGLPADLGGLTLREGVELEAWLAELRERLVVVAVDILANPPRPSVTADEPSPTKVGLMTGGSCFLFFALIDGLQLNDLFAFTHGGLLGGFLVWGLLRWVRRQLPERWRSVGIARFEAIVKGRLEPYVNSRREHIVNTTPSA